MLLNQLRRFAAVASAIAIALAFSTIASAATLSIFNTGVDPSANALVGTGIPDPHYSIISPANNTAVTVNDPGYPFPFWIANNPASRWIGPTGNGDGVPGPWIYRTTFNVPATAILGTVNVSGDWATDDNGTDIRINGTPTGQTDLGMGTLAPFSVSTGFVYGLNTLDFYVTNASLGVNPTGLRVDHIVGTYQVVPEPSMIALAAGGLAISVGVSRRKRRGAMNA